MLVSISCFYGLFVSIELIVVYLSTEHEFLFVYSSTQYEAEKKSFNQKVPSEVRM